MELQFCYNRVPLRESRSIIRVSSNQGAEWLLTASDSFCACLGPHTPMYLHTGNIANWSNLKSRKSSDIPSHELHQSFARTLQKGLIILIWSIRNSLYNTEGSDAKLITPFPPINESLKKKRFFQNSSVRIKAHVPMTRTHGACAYKGDISSSIFSTKRVLSIVLDRYFSTIA